MTTNAVTMRAGTEGPRHDPYFYTEVGLDCRFGKITYHSGLAEWTSYESAIGCGTIEGDGAHTAFVQLTGITPERLLKIHLELPFRRHAAKCSGREFRSESGFPGETFTVCCKCNEIVDSRFNHSAVE